MARRGFFAALQRASRESAKQRERQKKEAVRAHQAALKNAEQAMKRQARAQALLAKASEQDRKRLEREAKEAHVEAMEAEVEEKNSNLAEIADELDSLLSSTLDVDDFVDLNSLRASTAHEPFSRPDLESPIPLPLEEPPPPEPRYEPPQAPSGLLSFLLKSKYAKAVEATQARHEQDLDQWRRDLVKAKARHAQALRVHADLEVKRLQQLDEARKRHEVACAKQEQEAIASNARLDELIANLGYGVPEAVQEYISVVLSNSVYPSHFSVAHEFEFDPASAELKLKVLVPEPEEMPSVKSYRYVKSSDDIVPTELSAKARRERYGDVLNQVALRSLHEVFESDRRSLIRTVALEVGTEAVDPSTGNSSYVPLLAVGAERDEFLSFDLSAVVPSKTLERLGASVSKSPSDLIPAVRSGVRKS